MCATAPARSSRTGSSWSRYRWWHPRTGAERLETRRPLLHEAAHPLREVGRTVHLLHQLGRLAARVVECEIPMVRELVLGDGHRQGATIVGEVVRVRDGSAEQLVGLHDPVH